MAVKQTYERFNVVIYGNVKNENKMLINTNKWPVNEFTFLGAEPTAHF